MSTIGNCDENSFRITTTSYKIGLPNLFPYSEIEYFSYMKSGIQLTDLQLMKREKQRIAIASVLAAVFLTSMKLFIGLWTGSLGILSEAAHSGLDLLAAGITLYAVRLADRPPDFDHQFGHGKFENLSALAETILLLITCGWILYEATNRLMLRDYAVEINVYAFAVIGISIIIDISRSRALYRVARKYNSQALEADALHFSTDIYSSIVVLFGLVAVQSGFPEGDAIAASLVAIIVIWISYRLGKRTIDVLLDRVPSGVREKVHELVTQVAGVDELRSMRIRQSGANYFIDLVIGIKRRSTFDQVHSIMDKVEFSVMQSIPRADVIVHSEPIIGIDDELPDSISWLVQNNGLVPHNVSILRMNGNIRIELDIEYPYGTSFENAHVLASHVEKQIKNNLDSVEAVCVHLEEESSKAIPVVDVTKNESDLVHRVETEILAHKEVQQCNSISCFQSKRGLNISVQCSLNGSFSLKQAHDIVSEVETDISHVDPRIVKVFIRAEPYRRIDLQF